MSSDSAYSEDSVGPIRKRRYGSRYDPVKRPTALDAVQGARVLGNIHKNQRAKRVHLRLQTHVERMSSDRRRVMAQRIQRRYRYRLQTKPAAKAPLTIDNAGLIVHRRLDRQRREQKELFHKRTKGWYRRRAMVRAAIKIQKVWRGHYFREHRWRRGGMKRQAIKDYRSQAAHLLNKHHDGKTKVKKKPMWKRTLPHGPVPNYMAPTDDMLRHMSKATREEVEILVRQHELEEYGVRKHRHVKTQRSGLSTRERSSSQEGRTRRRSTFVDKAKKDKEQEQRVVSKSAGHHLLSGRHLVRLKNKNKNHQDNNEANETFPVHKKRLAAGSSKFSRQFKTHRTLTKTPNTMATSTSQRARRRKTHGHERTRVRSRGSSGSPGSPGYMANTSSARQQGRYVPGDASHAGPDPSQAGAGAEAQAQAEKKETPRSRRTTRTGARTRTKTTRRLKTKKAKTKIKTPTRASKVSTMAMRSSMRARGKSRRHSHLFGGGAPAAAAAGARTRIRNQPDAVDIASKIRTKFDLGAENHCATQSVVASALAEGMRLVGETTQFNSLGLTPHDVSVLVGLASSECVALVAEDRQYQGSAFKLALHSCVLAGIEQEEALERAFEASLHVIARGTWTGNGLNVTTVQDELHRTCVLAGKHGQQQQHENTGSITRPNTAAAAAALQNRGRNRRLSISAWHKHASLPHSVMSKLVACINFWVDSVLDLMRVEPGQKGHDAVMLCAHRIHDGGRNICRSMKIPFSSALLTVVRAIATHRLRDPGLRNASKRTRKEAEIFLGQLAKELFVDAVEDQIKHIHAVAESQRLRNDAQELEYETFMYSEDELQGLRVQAGRAIVRIVAMERVKHEFEARLVSSYEDHSHAHHAEKVEAMKHEIVMAAAAAGLEVGLSGADAKFTAVLAVRAAVIAFGPSFKYDGLVDAINAAHKALPLRSSAGEVSLRTQTVVAVMAAGKTWQAQDDSAWVLLQALARGRQARKYVPLWLLEIRRANTKMDHGMHELMAIKRKWGHHRVEKLQHAAAMAQAAWRGAKARKQFAREKRELAKIREARVEAYLEQLDKRRGRHVMTRVGSNRESARLMLAHFESAAKGTAKATVSLRRLEARARGIHDAEAAELENYEDVEEEFTEWARAWRRGTIIKEHDAGVRRSLESESRPQRIRTSFRNAEKQRDGHFEEVLSERIDRQLWLSNDFAEKPTEELEAYPAGDFPTMEMGARKAFGQTRVTSVGDTREVKERVETQRQALKRVGTRRLGYSHQRQQVRMERRRQHRRKHAAFLKKPRVVVRPHVSKVKAKAKARQRSMAPSSSAATKPGKQASLADAFFLPEIDAKNVQETSRTSSSPARQAQAGRRRIEPPRTHPMTRSRPKMSRRLTLRLAAASDRRRKKQREHQLEREERVLHGRVKERERERKRQTRRPRKKNKKEKAVDVDPYLVPVEVPYHSGSKHARSKQLTPSRQAKRAEDQTERKKTTKKKKGKKKKKKKKTGEKNGRMMAVYDDVTQSDRPFRNESNHGAVRVLRASNVKWESRRPASARKTSRTSKPAMAVSTRPWTASRGSFAAASMRKLAMLPSLRFSKQ